MRSTSAGAEPAALSAVFRAVIDFCASGATFTIGESLEPAWPATNTSPSGFISFFATAMDSITTCAPSIGSAPTWITLTAGSGRCFSVKVSLTMAGTRRRSPLPATSARSFTMLAPPELLSSAFNASRNCCESNPFALSGDT